MLYFSGHKLFYLGGAQDKTRGEYTYGLSKQVPRIG